MSLQEVIREFCSIALLLLFAYSAGGKVRNVTAFARSVEGFAVVPSTWVVPLARLFIGAEGIVVVLLLGGLVWSGVLLAGMLLALGLLVVFSSALISVMIRGLQVPCGCFGTDDRPVATVDLVRNAGLIVLSVAGLATASSQHSILASLLTALMAATFVVIWTHLDDITAVLRWEPVVLKEGK
ncbi:MAG: hypothetical protein JO202_17790 [Ktedonobacteraceae bacterium]|nr:hypothetical protein [Ktedonobacteraceae bacterium]